MSSAKSVHAQNLDDTANAGVIVDDDIRVSFFKTFCPHRTGPLRGPPPPHRGVPRARDSAASFAWSVTASMMWLSFAEKEFKPEFEIALSEDLFDRPLF